MSSVRLVDDPFSFCSQLLGSKIVLTNNIIKEPTVEQFLATIQTSLLDKVKMEVRRSTTFDRSFGVVRSCPSPICHGRRINLTRVRRSLIVCFRW